MRLIMGLDAPDAGQARIGGRPYRALRWPLREVGALLEAHTFHPGRSARNHLLALAAGNAIAGARVIEILGAVGLTGVARKRAGTFSLGMAQRLGIAAALLGDPGVLLFDEPANGLDPEGVRWLRNLLRSLAADGRTVLLSSHLISEMALTADRLVVIGRGRLLADAPVGDLLARYGSLEDAYFGLTGGSAEYQGADPVSPLGAPPVPPVPPVLPAPPFPPALPVTPTPSALSVAPVPPVTPALPVTPTPSALSVAPVPPVTPALPVTPTPSALSVPPVTPAPVRARAGRRRS
jgi:ABC-2 type transport system ATP-binding protein